MAAFHKAVAQGATFIETDLQLSRDARFVAIHDATVDRTTGVRSSVHDLTLAELRLATGVPLRVGARVLAWGMRPGAPGQAFATRVVRRLGGHDEDPTYRSVVCVDLERRHNCE